MPIPWRTHWAVIKSSGRIVPVEVVGPIFWVIGPPTGYSANNHYHGPYRRNCPAFQLLPRWLDVSRLLDAQGRSRPSYV